MVGFEHKSQATAAATAPEALAAAPAAPAPEAVAAAPTESAETRVVAPAEVAEEVPEVQESDAAESQQQSDAESHHTPRHREGDEDNEDGKNLANSS